MSKSYQAAHFKVRSAMFGIDHPTPRWQNCVRWVKKALPFGVGALFIDKYFSSRSKKQVRFVCHYFVLTFVLHQIFFHLLSYVGYCREQVE